MKEKEKRNYKKIIIIILAILLTMSCITIVLYKLGTKEKKEDEGETSIQEQQLDVSAIDMNTNLPGQVYEPEKLEELAKTSEVADLPKYPSAKYKYNNDYFYLIVNKNGNEKEYHNVKQIYYTTHESCNFYMKFFLLTDDKVIIVVFDSMKSINGIMELNTYSNKKYDSIYSIWVRAETCGAEFEYIGHTEDDKYYNLENGEEIDTNIQYNYYGIININRKLQYKNINLDVKAVLKSNVDSKLEYIVDSNGYLYKFNSQEDGTYEIEKVSDKKVKTIYYEYFEENYEDAITISYNIPTKIEYEDETKYEEDTLLEWSKIEY